MTYSIITALVETDHDQIEILYDEGYRGDDALNESATHAYTKFRIVWINTS